MNHQDSDYLKEMMNHLVRTFSSFDLEWVQAVEALLNAVFNLRTKNSPEFAKWIIQQLTRRLLQTEPLDVHFTKLFFVVGHTAIKMLTFIEQMDNELKKSGSEAFVHKDKPDGGKNDEELDHIAGGKEA